jgi:hypothetical protein
VTYRVGETVPLLVPSAITTGVTCAVTAPDGTASAPSATYGSGAWSASVPAAQAGDYQYVFAGNGFYYRDQFHVVAGGLNIVGLGEVKEHGNITSTTADRELLDFIGTAQQMIENEVGAVVPATWTAERQAISPGGIVFLNHAPVLEVTSVAEYNGSVLMATLAPGDYLADLAAGTLTRLTGGATTRWSAPTALVTYRAGRAPIPEAIRWAAKELTIHLWRATQSQRGGRGRSGGGDVEGSVAALSYALPNRVVDALAPFARGPAVA